MRKGQTDRDQTSSYERYDKVYDYPYYRNDSAIGHGFVRADYISYGDWLVQEAGETTAKRWDKILWPDLSWRRASVRSFRMAFSNHDVQALFKTAVTFRGMAPNFDPYPDATHDNCTSSISKIYDEHAKLAYTGQGPFEPYAVRRGLELPEQTYSIFSARNWAKYAVGSGDLGLYNSLQPGGTWLQDHGWIVVGHVEKLSVL